MTGLPRQPAERPRLELPPDDLERTMTLLAWLGVVAHVLLVAVYWPRLPAEVPRHFDALGRVDAWGPLWVLVFLPALALVLVAALGWLRRHPHRYNYLWPITEENACRQYRLAIDLLAVMRAVIAWLLCLISLEICRLAVGRPPLLGAYFLPLGLGAMLAVIGWYVLRAHRER